MKLDKATLIFKSIYFISIFLFPILVILTLVLKWPIWISFAYVGFVIALYLIVHIIHTMKYHYICPKCNTRFKISLIKDITAYNAKPGAKVLVCPKCNIKEVMLCEYIE